MTELEKFADALPPMQIIGDFLDWCEEQKRELAEPTPGGYRLMPINEARSAMLARYFGFDPVKLENERRELLKLHSEYRHGVQYIVLCQQVVTGGKWGIVYNFDHQYFADKKEAIKHGFKIRDSDDFNIATVEDDTLTGFYWMDEDMSGDADAMRDIAAQLGLKLCDAAEEGSKERK